MHRATKLLAAGLAIAGAADATSYPPLPPRRPAGLGVALTPRVTEPAESRRDGEDEDCFARLAAAGIEYDSVARPDDPVCIISSPVRLKGVSISRNAKRAIHFPQRPLIDCRLAERVADWLREAVSPLLEVRLGVSLSAVVTGTGYECRTRNREAGSKLSAHAFGLALDISSFELANGQRLEVGASGKTASKAALESVRRTACGWFMTVLGPGSLDKLHETHLHVDMQLHGTAESHRVCE
jgi:hypothetical protein